MPEKVRLSQEQYEQIEDLSGCNYSPEKIAVYLDVPKKDFMAAWYDQESLVRYHYDRGQLVTDFDINLKALETAKAGNLTSMQIYQKNKDAVHVENLKKQILFAGEELEDEE